MLTGTAYADIAYTAEFAVKSADDVSLAYYYNSTMLSVSGTAQGVYPKGRLVFLTATAKTGYEFIGWYDNYGQLLSQDRGYSFKLEKDTELYPTAVKSSSPIPVDPSGQGGGGGSGIPKSDTIPSTDDSSDATIGAQAGLYTVWIPTQEQLTTFANDYLWNSDFLTGLSQLWNKIKSLGGEAMDYFYKAFHLPIYVDDKYRYTAEVLHSGAWNYDVETPMDWTDVPYISLSLGTIEVPAVYGNALDYQSKIKLWLPYLDFVDLDPRVFVGNKIGIIYTVSYLTGDFVARIYCVKSADDKYCYANYVGNMAQELPISKDNNLNNAIEGVGKTLISVGAKALTGGVL